jgi:hypothetical protein
LEQENGRLAMLPLLTRNRLDVHFPGVVELRQLEQAAFTLASFSLASLSAAYALCDD